MNIMFIFMALLGFGVVYYFCAVFSYKSKKYEYVDSRNLYEENEYFKRKDFEKRLGLKDSDIDEEFAKIRKRLDWFYEREEP